DIADRVRNLLDVARNALIALATNADRPAHRLAFTGTAFPRRADLAQIMGEVEARARAIGAVDHRDGGRGQLQPGVEPGQDRIVPALHLPGIDVGEHRPRELELTCGEARNVYDRDDSADDDRKLH